jgi:Domain of unknown function (DUF1905)/Bacteriocin-protection, YdeI or OmpD-Associated
MKKKKLPERGPAPKKKLSFHSTLRNIARGMEYFALTVPAEITRALGTRTAVPVTAQINDSERFLASLYPRGGGRHGLRVRNAICKAIGIQEGDRVRVKITVRDRSEEVSVPQDVKRALRTSGVAAGFAALPIGKRSFLLRTIDEAARPETREKRIREAVEVARQRKSLAT